MNEKALVLACGDEALVGVLHLPENVARLGVVVVVGGPQYRVGSHRQFVLLGRALAAGGFACLRFDYRGMGDSATAGRSFEQVDEDIGSAIDALLLACPALDGVVLWGLCDGASAALMYAPRDPRVAGIVALNPWVRSEATLASARLNHHYRGRLLSARFWRRLLGGEVHIGRALEGLVATLRQRLRGQGREDAASTREAFIARMEAGWRQMRGRVLFVLSGNDLTAREFADFCRAHPDWRPALQAGPNLAEVEGADHTFSTRAWCGTVERITLDWLRALAASSALSACAAVEAGVKASPQRRSA